MPEDLNEIDEIDLDRSKLVPRIKSVHFISSLKEMQTARNDFPYTEPFVGDLIIAYAFDLPDLFMMATLESIKAAGLTPKEVKKVAISNLRKQIPEIGFQRQGRIYKIVSEIDLEACTLLAKPFWKQIEDRFDEAIVAAIPHRNRVYFTGESNSRGLRELKSIRDNILDSPDPHNLSDFLFCWRDSCWSVFEDNSDD